MAFGTNSIYVPKSYSDWVVWFSRQPTVTQNKGTKKLGRNDEILRSESAFLFEFHGHRIAEYTPEYTRLYTRGWGMRWIRAPYALGWTMPERFRPPISPASLVPAPARQPDGGLVALGVLAPAFAIRP